MPIPHEIEKVTPPSKPKINAKDYSDQIAAAAQGKSPESLNPEESISRDKTIIETHNKLAQLLEELNILRTNTSIASTREGIEKLRKNIIALLEFHEESVKLIRKGTDIFE